MYGTVALKYFNVINGITVGDITLDAATGNATVTNLTVTSLTSLGNVSNVSITGGTAGQVLTTDGEGSLTFSNPTVLQSPAPMPYYIDESTALVIPQYYQGLFSVPITIDGSLEIDGILVEV